MREPAFWWRPPGPAAPLLQPLASIYGTVAASRLHRPGQRVGIPILCIGNLTLGGAGKTPTAIAIGSLLRESGGRPFFLSRGYGGRLSGPVLVDSARHTAIEVGDEPLLLARTAPTIVARDRLAGAQAARAAGASLVLMDDGFQNPSLAKDLSILVIDGRRGIGNGRVFPAGPLRAPLTAQIERADGLLVIGGRGSGIDSLLEGGQRGLPIFSARLAPNPDDVAELAGKPLLAFAGIGDPDKFFITLQSAGLDVRARRAFADHHQYTGRDADALLSQAAIGGLSLVTTEKDMVRLAGREEMVRLAEMTRTLGVTLTLDESEPFAKFIRRSIP